MLVKKEFDFDFYDDTWSGAQDRMHSLTDELRTELENIIEGEVAAVFGEEIPTDTAVNDFLWFEDDTYAEWLGFDSADQMWKYCDLINEGIDEDEIWIDENYPDKLKTTQDIIDEFETYKLDDPDWQDAYSDWEEFAEDNDYTTFERN